MVKKEPVNTDEQEITDGWLEAEEIRQEMHMQSRWVTRERFLTASRRRYHPSELPEHLKAAVRYARMNPEHEHLNRLLDE